jgi:hypothetical protein
LNISNENLSIPAGGVVADNSIHLIYENQNGPKIKNLDQKASNLE